MLAEEVGMDGFPEVSAGYGLVTQGSGNFDLSPGTVGSPFALRGGGRGCVLGYLGDDDDISGPAPVAWRT